MINFMKAWCEGIIVAVIIAIIIEMILPENANKKYVKVVIGIYIIFTIINPLVKNLNSNIDFSSVLNYEQESEKQINEESVKKIYIDGIELSLKQEIEKKDFTVLYLEVNFDELYENIEQIILKIKENENNIINIEKVEINKNNIDPTIDETKINDLKKIISENYMISIDKIHIN